MYSLCSYVYSYVCILRYVSLLLKNDDYDDDDGVAESEARGSVRMETVSSGVALLGCRRCVYPIILRVHPKSHGEQFLVG